MTNETTFSRHFSTRCVEPQSTVCALYPFNDFSGELVLLQANTTTLWLTFLITFLHLAISSRDSFVIVVTDDPLLIKTYTVFHNLRLEDTNVFPVAYCYETFVWTELLKLLPLHDLKLFLVYLRPYIAKPVVLMNEQIMVTD